MLKYSALVFIIVSVAKLLAFLRELLLAYFFGADKASDILVFSLMPITIITSLLGANFGSVVQPTFNTNKGFVNRVFSQSVFKLMAILGSLGVVIFTVLSQLYLSLDVIVAQIIFYLSPALILSISSYWFISYRNYKKDFVWTALAQLPISVSLMFAIIVYYETTSPLWYSATISAGYLASFMMLQKDLVIYRFKLKYLSNTSFISYTASSLSKLAIVIAISLVGLADQTIDRLFALSEGDGAVSLLNYAFKLAQLPIFTLGLALSTVGVSYFIKSNGNSERVGIVHRLWFVQISLSIVVAVIIWRFSQEIVTYAYFRGEFSKSDVEITSILLELYTFGIMGHLLILTGVKLCIALNKLQFAVHASLAALVVKLISNFIFFNLYGIAGLALATSLASSVNGCILLMYLVRHRSKF